MGLMTTDLLLKCTGQAKKKKEESREQYLKRITHLYCAEKGIDKIESVSQCRCLSVLYLYDNFISKIENLDRCTLLTHLYLQNNTITQISNLASLRRLSKLYLDNNAITVVEGLETLDNLSELYISHQVLPEGEKLLFDPRSISAISDTLCVLNVSGNRLDCIKDLTCLTKMTSFSACDNRLTSMKDINRVFSQWNMLARVELSGNPLCHKHKYHDRVITMGSSIVNLDGREITETERTFLLKWKEMRKARHRQEKKVASDTTIESSSHSIPHHTKKIMPVHPLTMPALPARQLPRKSKTRHLANLDITSHVGHNIEKTALAWNGEYVLSEAVSGTRTNDTKDSKTYKFMDESAQGNEKADNLKLPEIVPHQSLIAQSGNLLSGLQPDNLQRKLWQASRNIPAKVFE